MADESDSIEILNDLVVRALKAGAAAADAVDVKSIALSHAQRLGEVEKVERAESRDLGLRVFFGQKQAIASSTDPGEDAALSELVERAISMAKAVPDDENCGLADPEQILTADVPDLDIADLEEPSTEVLAERASECEAAAQAVLGITNSEGAEASWSSSDVSIAASNGFAGAYRSTGHGTGWRFWRVKGPVWSATTNRRVRHTLRISTHQTMLAKRPANGLWHGLTREVETQQVPVVFAPRVSNGLVRHFAGAVNGSAIARGTSFLKDSMGERVFPEGIHIIDDPHRKRGHRSKPFDAEGLPNGAMHLVEDGVLENWMLDLSTARKLGLESNGRASRGTSSPPSPSTTNLYMTAGRSRPPI